MGLLDLDVMAVNMFGAPINLADGTGWAAWASFVWIFNDVQIIKNGCQNSLDSCYSLGSIILLLSVLACSHQDDR